MKIPMILSYKTLTKSGEINQAYSNAIQQSGGILKMIDKKEDIDKYFDDVSGVLLPGGADINPFLYKEEKRDNTQKSNNMRDEFEIYLIKKAIEKNLPILGVCRGIQILNVYFGGTLYQDLKIDMKNSIKHDCHADGPRSLLSHKVSILEDSLLYRILGTSDIEVNSLHHQGIKNIGDGLVEVSFSSDGLIEAIEKPDYKYLVGVQWHPEELLDNTKWKNFFDNYIRVCSRIDL